MTAASVTGIGQGSADKAGQKGSEHVFWGVEKLIGVRVIFADIVVCGGTTTTVTLPAKLPGVDSDYAVLLTGIGATIPYLNAAPALASAGTFVIHATTSVVVHYAVVRVHNATVTVG